MDAEQVKNIEKRIVNLEKILRGLIEILDERSSGFETLIDEFSDNIDKEIQRWVT